MRPQARFFTQPFRETYRREPLYGLRYLRERRKTLRPNRVRRARSDAPVERGRPAE